MTCCGDILEYYDDIHLFITRLCLAEKLPQSCLSTAMVLFHKYFIFKKQFKNEFEKYLTCTTCIFLAIKLCNQLTPLKELLTYFIKSYSKKLNINVTIDDQLIFEDNEQLFLIRI